MNRTQRQDLLAKNLNFVKIKGIQVDFLGVVIAKDRKFFDNFIYFSLTRVSLCIYASSLRWEHTGRRQHPGCIHHDKRYNLLDDNNNQDERHQSERKEMRERLIIRSERDVVTNLNKSDLFVTMNLCSRQVIGAPPDLTRS